MPIELGVIQDSDSCETAVFDPSTNPFTNIQYMISGLVTSSEQQLVTVELNSLWSSCAFTIQVSPDPSIHAWLTVDYVSATGALKVLVETNDTGLVGSTFTVDINLVPSYRDSLGNP